MTEIERLLCEGIISESFLLPETRCDFFIDEKRKKIWAVSIDLLLALDKVCRRNNLRYYLAYGTLLGAIRHNGFIPWDDDIDVCMPRKDYERLQELKDEFLSPYFLQMPQTDARYYYSYMKLRNSNTTSLSKNFFSDNNNGISIDIFCVDKWERNEQGEQLYNRIKELIINNSTYMKLGNPNFIDDERVINYNGADPMETYLEIHKLSKNYYDVDTKYVSMPTITVYGYERDLFDIDDFASTVLHQFEFVKLPIPIGFNKILTCIYGDYMKFPPVEARGKWHTAILDAEKPYPYYVELINKGVQLWGQ